MYRAKHPAELPWVLPSEPGGIGHGLCQWAAPGVTAKPLPPASVRQYGYEGVGETARTWQ